MAGNKVEWDVNKELVVLIMRPEKLWNRMALDKIAGWSLVALPSGRQ